MKKQLTTIFFIFVVMGCTAMAQNSTIKKVPIYGEQILVRSYNTTHEIIFGHGNPPGAAINPNMGIKRTTIALRDINNNQVTQIAELPVNYRVYDAQIVSLKESIYGKDIDFCVFCGTKTVDNGEWIFDFFTGNPIWLSSIDSSGFVGLFYLNNNVPNPGFANNVYIREIEGAKHLFKMAAYAEHYGEFCSYCGTVYYDNAVLDIVGLAADSIYGASCITRVKFYPECNNSSIKWDTDIRIPGIGLGETVTDITATDQHIITVSTIPSDTQSVYLRKNEKDTICHIGGLAFSNTLYRLNLNNLTISGLPYNAYFKKPVRVTRLTGSDAVVSFIGISTQSSSNSCEGLFSFRVNPPNIIAGAYDNISGTLVDVCRHIDTIASVALIKLPENNNHEINTLRWSTNLYMTYPLFSLYDNTSPSLQSIDGHKSPYGIHYLLIGGLVGPNIDRQWKLLDQEYFNSTFSPYCISNSTRNIPRAQIGTNTTTGDFITHRRYDDDIINYPMTLITRTSTSVSLTGLCSQYGY